MRRLAAAIIFLTYGSIFLMAATGVNMALSVLGVNGVMDTFAVCWTTGLFWWFAYLIYRNASEAYRKIRFSSSESSQHSP